jgi:hypothetical protein
MNAAVAISDLNDDGDSTRTRPRSLDGGSVSDGAQKEVVETKEALSTEVVRAKTISAADAQAQGRVPSVRLPADHADAGTTDATQPTAAANEVREKSVSEVEDYSLLLPSDVSQRPRLERLEMVSPGIPPPLVPISAIGDAVIGTSNVQENPSFMEPVISHRPQLDRLEMVPSEVPSLLPISAIGKVAPFAEVEGDNPKPNEDWNSTALLENESNGEGELDIATFMKNTPDVSGDERVLEAVRRIHSSCETFWGV